MAQFDRYIFFQLMSLFGLFSLVLVSVYWVNQAARLFDALIADGQNLAVVAEFSALTLPWTIQLILPVSAFVATLYAFNRLINESELVVLQTAGVSAGRMIWPVLVFGLVMGALVALLGNVLAPQARAQFMDRQQEVSDDLTGQFLRAGEFIHPRPGITVYIRDISDIGEFSDLFLQDASVPNREVTYAAQTAYLISSETGPRLLMLNGVAQTLDLQTDHLATVHFSEFTYDVGMRDGAGTGRRLDVRELPTPVLLRADPQIAERTGRPTSYLVFEGHDRIAQSLFAIIVPVIGAACLMLGSFSRFGVWRQIMVAVALVLPMQIVRNAAKGVVRADEDAWIAAYGQPAIAALVALVIILIAMRRRGWRSIPA